MGYDFRLLVEHAQDGIALLDRSGNVLFLTHGLLDLLGQTESSLIGRSVFELVPDDEMAVGRTKFETCVDTPGSSVKMSGHIKHRDSTLRFVECALTNRLGHLGIDAVVLHVRDATKRREADLARRRAEDRLRLAADATGLATFEYDPSARVFEGCATFEAMGGLAGFGNRVPLAEFLALVHPADRENFERWLTEIFSGGREQFDFRLVAAGQERRMLSVRGRALRSVSGALHAFGVIVDITEAQRAHDERERDHLRQFETRQLREFVARMVAAQEDERRRLSRELHDETAQQLVALMLGLETLRAESHGRPRALARVAQLHEVAERLGRDVHRMAIDLRPSALDDHGLRHALATYTQRWAERLAIPVDLHVDDLDALRLPPDCETALFRIVQEALTNVARHAKARHVAVSLSQTSGQFVVRIADDGVGFESKAMWTSGSVRSRLGLLSMRERAILIGGELSIESAPGLGTVITVLAPLAGAA